MTFQKGKSGNPKGRKLETEQQKRIAADLLSPFVDRAVQNVSEFLESHDAESAQWATKLVFEYVFGKPPQAVSLEVPSGIAYRIVVEKSD